MFELSGEIIAKANKCKRNYACLNEKTPPLCSVSDCVNCEIHFISTQTSYCPYFLYFADEVICTCPVRKELFNKFKI